LIYVSTSILPYADYAELYLELGFSPLPLPVGKKKSPPTGYTGYDGKDVTAEDVAIWIEQMPDGNIALRLPRGTIGIDVDAYKGPAQLAKWEKLVSDLGELPETSSCSSRDDGISGIRFYRVPVDYVAEDMGIAGEVIQHHHRYAVVPPSIHPDTKNEYTWADGMMRGVDELPELPQAWLDALRKSAKTTRSKSTSAGFPSGYTNPHIPELVRNGIPDGVNQETTLRDVAWKLACDGVSRDEALTTYRTIASKTKLTNPAWAWSEEDFSRHYDRAVKKVASNEPSNEDIFTGELTDALLAERFTDDVLDGRYCWASGLGWMKWDGKRWSHAPDEAVKEECRQWVKTRTQEAARAAAETDDIKGNLRRANDWLRIQAKSRIEAIVSLSRGIVLRAGSEFDDKPDYLNAANGIVDLRTGDLLPHNPSYLLTRLADTDYRPGAEHQDWTSAMEALPDDVRAWYLARLGQAITGYTTPDDMMIVQQGTGANGKSTVMAAIQAAIGDYYHVVSHRALLADASTHPTELMDFRGARMSVLEETPEEGRLSVTRLKMLVGTPQITARRIHQDAVTFNASHSLFINTNYRPLVDQTDHGTWRRLALVVFPYKYVKKEKIKGDNDREGDAQLRERLRTGKEQREAVLGSLVEYAVAWYKNGKMMPELPEKVEEDTQAWRKESDLILSYADERLVFDAGKHVTAKDLLADFNEWLQGKNMRAWGDKTFSQRFGDHELAQEHHAEKKFTARKPGLSRSANSFDKPTEHYHAWFGVSFLDEPTDQKQEWQSKGI
jgi:putative DNA primase/helicase